MHCEYALENTGNKVLRGVEFVALAPADGAAGQQQVRLKTTPEAEVAGDEAGNQVVRFRIDRLAPYATAMVKIEAELKVGEEIETDVAPGDWLAPEVFVESDHPEIRALAQELVGQDVTMTANAIYTWVVKNVEHAGFVSQDLGALAALRNRSGDCTEMSYLFVALCRAAGVPARVIGGFLQDRDGKLNARYYHNWAEFHDGKAWRLVDCQFKRFDEGGDKYVATKIFGNNTIADFHRCKVSHDAVAVRME
ncbi:MAG: transglutaminase domain-containing protein [Kiritimatiellae bacterium]|nr:transglutaminase domain-containing protein [Kiritimatiellia bacterium]